MSLCDPIEWEEPLDPSGVKDYVADFTAWLAKDTDSIVSHTVTLSAEAIAGGLEESQASSLVGTDGVRIWFKVNAANQGDAEYNNSGTRFNVEVEIVTSGGRTEPQTWSLLVKQQ